MRYTARLAACALALGALAYGPGVAAGPQAAKPSSSVRPSAPASGAPALERLAKQAVAAKDAGRTEDAIALYRKGLALDPSWTLGHWSLATLLYDQSRFAEAREHFRHSVAAQPRNGLAWAMTGLCDVRLKEYEVALADLQQAAFLGVADPSVRSMALFQTALLLNHAGNPEGAFEILREFAAQGLDNPSVIVAFGLSILRLPLFPEEVPAEKREMIQLAGRGAYHLARGRRTAIGRLALEELVSRYPAEPNVRYALGSYIAPEDPEAAIGEFRKELQRAPDHYPSLLQIAQLETRRGRAAEALPFAEQAVTLAPGIPAARLVLGRALLELGEAGRAAQELEKGASLAPRNADLQFSLARAYQRLGRADDAARARQEFLRLDQAARERQAKPAVETKENEPS